MGITQRKCIYENRKGISDGSQSVSDLRINGINVDNMNSDELSNAINAPKEIRGYLHAYKNQGLYRNTTIDFVGQINNIFGPYIVPNPYEYNPSKFQRIFYSIPRLW